MIPKKDLVGKFITYIDSQDKQRTEKVVKVKGSYVTVKNAYKVKHRVHKDRILGRQFRKKGIEEIKWLILLNLTYITIQILSRVKVT